MKRQHFGYTAVELLMTIGILGLLAAISVPSYASAQQKMRVRQAADELADVIRQAQTKAVAGVGGSTITVSIGSSTVTTTVNATGTVTTWTAPTGVSFTSANPNITFGKLAGRPSTTSSVAVTNGSGQFKTVTVSPAGKIATN